MKLLRFKKMVLTVNRLFNALYSHCLCYSLNDRLCPHRLLKDIPRYLFKDWYSSSSGFDFSHPSNKAGTTNLKPPWRIMFFGSDEFAVESLKTLYSKYRTETTIGKLDVITAFCEHTSRKNPIYNFAKSENITLYKWPSSFDDLFGKYDLGVIVSFGHLIPEKIIKLFPLGILNVHASLLPKWRGPAPIIRAIMHGDTITGITIMKIKADKFDVGDVVRQYSVSISAEERAIELTHRLAKLGARLLMECIRDLPRSVLFATPQSSENISYAKKVTKKDAEVDWDKKTAEEVYNLYRAINHVHHLTTSWFDQPVKLLHIKLDSTTVFNPVNRVEISRLGSTNPIFPGLVEFSPSRSVIRVQCKDGYWINVSTILLPGKRTGKTCLSAREFFNGYVTKVKYTLDRKFRFKLTK